MSVTISGSGQIVKQIINATYSTQFTTSSSSLVNVGLTATITPTNSANKILVIVSMPCLSGVSGQNVLLTVYRNGSNIAPNTYLGMMQGNSSPVFGTLGINLLDSPATTSAVTYTLYGSSSGGSTGYFNSLPTSTSSVITLMEIAYA